MDHREVRHSIPSVEYLKVTFGFWFSWLEAYITGEFAIMSRRVISACQLSQRTLYRKDEVGNVSPIDEPLQRYFQAVYPGETISTIV